MKKLTVILDPAHGSNVQGKQSPDGSYKEWIGSRKVCGYLYSLLKLKGFRVVFTTEGELEPGLDERVKTANAISGDYKIMLSLHNNAAGNTSVWLNARGFEVWTYYGESVSDVYAEIIYQKLLENFPLFKARYDISDGDHDKEAGFYVLKHTDFPAVLVEWLFMDNREDCSILKDENSVMAYANVLASAIEEIEQKIQSYELS